MWWKLVAIFGLGAFVLASAGLLCEPPGQEQGGQTAPVELSWVDEETGKVLFTVADIVRFDWEHQLFELERSRAMDLTTWLGTHWSATPGFEVRDADGLIYAGYFNAVPGLELAPKPNIVIPLESSWLHIRDSSSDEAAPSAARLLVALDEAGVLGEISDEEQPMPFNRICTCWVGDKQEIAVRTEYFPETFRVGEECRAHVFLSDSPGPRLTNAEWTITIKLLANEGRFRSESLIEGIEPYTLFGEGNGFLHCYICRFRPWQPTSGSVESAPEPGPGKVSLIVTAKKRNGEAVQTVGMWRTHQQKVTILPAN